VECNIKANIEKCSCTYEPCSRKGKCCECVTYHRSQGELPGCFLHPADERTYDRSIESFVQSFSKNK
jgi:hypothetical protein